MNVNLYSVSDPPNKIKKTLGNSLEITNVRFVDDDALNVTNPTIIIDISTLENVENDVSFLATYNYAKIPKFSRYYYITNMSTEGARVVISCEVDPLMSFASDILASSQYITRSETQQNRYIVDPLLPIESRHKYYCKEFTDSVYDSHCHNVILETIGKGGAVV